MTSFCHVHICFKDHLGTLHATTHPCTKPQSTLGPSQITQSNLPYKTVVCLNSHLSLSKIPLRMRSLWSLLLQSRVFLEVINSSHLSDEVKISSYNFSSLSLLYCLQQLEQICLPASQKCFKVPEISLISFVFSFYIFKELSQNALKITLKNCLK